MNQLNKFLLFNSLPDRNQEQGWNRFIFIAAKISRATQIVTLAP